MGSFFPSSEVHSAPSLFPLSFICSSTTQSTLSLVFSVSLFWPRVPAGGCQSCHLLISEARRAWQWSEQGNEEEVWSEGFTPPDGCSWVRGERSLRWGSARARVTEQSSGGEGDRLIYSPPPLSLSHLLFFSLPLSVSLSVCAVH